MQIVLFEEQRLEIKEINENAVPELEALSSHDAEESFYPELKVTDRPAHHKV